MCVGWPEDAEFRVIVLSAQIDAIVSEVVSLCEWKGVIFGSWVAVVSELCFV